MSNQKEIDYGKRLLLLLGGAAVIAIFLVVPSIAFVNAGYVGVPLTWGAVSGQLLSPGIHFIIPYMQSVVPMSTQVQLAQAFSSAASSDNQNVYVSSAVNYHILPSRAEQIYNNYSVYYSQSIISPAVQQAIKSSTAQFSAPNITKQREALTAMIQDKLEQKLATFGVVVDSIALTNVSYSKNFTEAIEQTAVAQQNLATQRNLLNITKVMANQTIVSANGNATARVISAEANATAIRLKANATAYQIAKINEQLNKSPSYIQYVLVNQWKGGVPSYLVTNGGSAGVPLLAFNISGTK